jgi:hypothetical protein
VDLTLRLIGGVFRGTHAEPVGCDWVFRAGSAGEAEAEGMVWNGGRGGDAVGFPDDMKVAVDGGSYVLSTLLYLTESSTPWLPIQCS